jgi:hypothetical protein
MFILSEKNISVVLSDINKIIISYFNLKSDVLDIFDNNYKFTENIIPAITSILETAPRIYNYKEYICIDNNIIISQNHKYYNTNKTYNNQYPSFYTDINALENNNKINITQNNLINTLIDNEDNQIIRLYNVKKIINNENTKNNTNFTQNILNEKENKKISWGFDWGSIDIIIDLKNNNCIYQIVIDIIEDCNLIHSRVKNINDILIKFNKIKSEFILN